MEGRQGTWRGKVSYDISFCVQTVEANAEGDRFAVVGVPEFSTPTYNLRPIFVKAMDWSYKQGEYYPMTEVMPRLKRALRELREHPGDYRPLEPSNRWGTVESAIECITNWIEELEDWGGVTFMWPIDTLWWRW